MMDHMLVTAKAQDIEWYGAKSAKFTTSKRHLPAPEAPKMPHPLFNMGGRKHFERRHDSEIPFKPIRRVIKPIDHESET